MLTAPPSISLPPVAVWPSPPTPAAWTNPSLVNELHVGRRNEGVEEEEIEEEEEEIARCHLPLPPPPSPPPPSSLLPVLIVTSSDLTYRGEGADHVVLGLRKLGQVLRLRKTCVGTCPSREELVSRAARDQEVLSRVGRALLGRLLTDTADLVLVSPRPDSALSDTLIPWRRANRQGKEINRHGVACICPDATTIFIPRQDTPAALSTTTLPPAPPWEEERKAGVGVIPYQVTPADTSTTTLPPAPPWQAEAGAGVGVGVLGQPYPREARTVCIEIKPKQGFLDRSTPDVPLCRYCVKQFLKGGKESGSRSGYCPLDLFSGNLERMRRAVSNLIQCPQNNFKVFVDGEPMDDSRPFHYLRDTIIAALTFDLNTGQPTMTSGKLSERSPLGRILTFQNLDQLGVFRAFQLYQTLCDILGSPQEVDKALSDLSDWPDLVTLHEEEEEVRGMIRRLQSYLLSTTAKDLSLMILLSGPYYSPAPPTPAGTSPFIIHASEPSVGRSGAYIAGVEGPEPGVRRSGDGETAVDRRVVSGTAVTIPEPGVKRPSAIQTAVNVSQAAVNVSKAAVNVSKTAVNVSKTAVNVSETAVNISKTAVNLSEPHGNNPGASQSSTTSAEPGLTRSGVNRCGRAWFRCQVTGVDMVAKPTSKILKHQKDYERLRDLLADLRMRGEEPSCCKI